MVGKALSRIFCLHGGGGGEVDPEKIFEPRGGEKKIFRSSRGPGDAPPENF